MCGGGGSPPAPPPDYTAQKDKFAADTLAQYQADADAYNSSVDAFNEQLDGYSSALSEGQSAYASADIYDLYDDPDTADVNEDALAGYQSELQNFDYDSITNADFGESPIFAPVVQSPWGPVTINNLPSLSQANTGLADEIYSGGQSLLTDINSLYDQRETEFDAFNQDALGIQNSYNAINNQISDADIASNLTGLNTSLGSVSADVNSLTSNPFYNQSQYADTNAAGMVSNLQNQINTLYAQRDAEYDRIRNYEVNINSTANTLAGETGGLTITDMDRLNAIENQIRDLERQSSQFNSKLGFDFSQELRGLGDAKGDIGRIRAERAAEEARVQKYRDETLDGIRGIRDTAFTTDMYDRGSIDALGQSLEDFKTDVGGFSSVLDYSVDGLDDYYTTIGERTHDLYGRRQDALDGLETRIGGVTDSLGGIQLYNESGFSDASRQLRDIGFDLGRFTGGRVDGIYEQIGEGQRAVDTKVRELAAYRSKLEEDMIELLTDIRTRDYYDFDDVASGRDDVYTKEQEVRLYNAQQAMDEIDDMLAELTSQDRRIKSDQKAVADRNASAASNVSFGNSMMSRDNFSPMTTSQYQAFINTQNEDPTYSYNPSAFSNALGVIRV